MRLGITSGAIAAGLALALASPARAGQLVLTPSDDTFVNSVASNNNMGGSVGIIIGVSGGTGGNAAMHGLVRFTIPTNLAGRVTVTSVTVDLYNLGIGTTNVAGTAATYTLKHLTESWLEGNASNDSQNNWVGGGACPGNAASWANRNCGAPTGWSTGGGTTDADVATADSGTGVNPVIGVGGTMTFASTAALVANVQNWIDNGNTTNFGWLITSNAGASSAQKWSSKEGGHAPKLTINFNCNVGTDLTTSCNLCTNAANGLCVTTQGNTCTDNGPPATLYVCDCLNGAYVANGNNTACNDLDECQPKPCNAGGDTMAGCMDHMAPSTGYTCNCSNGYMSNGTTCVSDCNGSPPDPCINGTCTKNGGGWTCMCQPGYVSTGGTNPSCINFDACSPAAKADCTAFSGNKCLDDMPPSLGYHCQCNNVATVPGTGMDGGPGCVDKNECIPNNCASQGDPASLCIDHVAPAVGYDCKCSKLWTPGTVLGVATCVDKNECAGANPCVNGRCTNLGAGGGYSCLCNPGFTSTGGPTPVCVHPDGCDATAEVACVSSELGNQCVDNPPPRSGHVCSCMNPAYTTSLDGRACVDKNECADNHCIDAGDTLANCVDHVAPIAGYECECDPGWTFDGTTCVDVNECLGGGNPCGHGTCSNTAGGYQCNCPSGFVSTGGTRPVCKANNTGQVTITTKAGGWCEVAPGAPPPPALLLMFAVLALLRLRRAGRSRL